MTFLYTYIVYFYHTPVTFSCPPPIFSVPFLREEYFFNNIAQQGNIKIENFTDYSLSSENPTVVINHIIIVINIDIVHMFWSFKEMQNSGLRMCGLVVAVLALCGKDLACTVSIQEGRKEDVDS